MKNAFNSFTKTTVSKSNIDFETANLIEAYFNITALEKSEYNHCYINVMNNKEIDDVAYKNMYIRKDHGYAHIAVLNFTKPTDTGFRSFATREYFYVTKVQNDTDVQIRVDLLSKWASVDNNVFVLAVDTHNNRVAKIPAKLFITKAAKAELIQAENHDFLKLVKIDHDDLIWTYIKASCPINHVKALMAEWKYLGNIRYNTYEARTEVKVVSYKQGNKSHTRVFKSIKQAYDLLKDAGFEMSYKTFQRRCNSDKPSLIETEKFTFYVTNKIDFEGPDHI